MDIFEELVRLRQMGQKCALATIVDYLTGGHLVESLEGRNMSRRIENLSGHTIVCGIGRVGSVVARALAEENAPFVIVDREDESIHAAQEAGWLCLQGEAADEATLEAVGVARARGKRSGCRLPNCPTGKSGETDMTTSIMKQVRPALLALLLLTSCARLSAAS